MMVERVSTGIPGLDELIGGGFPKNRTVLISGPCGAGKTIFSSQYLSKGCMDNGEPGVFVTIGERKARVIEHAANFGWDLKGLVDKNKLRIIDVTPSPKGAPEASKYVITDRPKQEFTIDSVAEILKENIDAIGAKRIAIDSLAALLFLPEAGLARRHELLSLIRMLEDSGCTSILTTEVPAGAPQPSTYAFEEFIADGLIRLYYSLYKNEYQRTLTIWKMRGTNHKRGVYSFDIADGRGIVVRTIAEWSVERI